MEVQREVIVLTNEENWYAGQRFGAGKSEREGGRMIFCFYSEGHARG